MTVRRSLCSSKTCKQTKSIMRSRKTENSNPQELLNYYISELIEFYGIFSSVSRRILNEIQ